MNALNGVLRAAARFVFEPMAGWPPIVPLLLVSAVSGVLAALVFRYVSNQDALRRVADKVRASLLALRLYKDDTVVTFEAVGGLFAASMARLWYSLSPLIVMIVPFMLLLFQMGMYYQFRPLVPGKDVIVQVDVLPEKWPDYSNIQLATPEGIAVEARHADSFDHNVSFRVRPTGDDVSGDLSIQLNGAEVASKAIVATNDMSRLHYFSPLRAGGGFWTRSNFGEYLMYPAEPAFPASSPIQRIEIHGVQAASTPLFGWDINWLITFLLASIVAALIAKPWIGVQF